MTLVKLDKRGLALPKGVAAIWAVVLLQVSIVNAEQSCEHYQQARTLIPLACLSQMLPNYRLAFDHLLSQFEQNGRKLPTVEGRFNSRYYPAEAALAFFVANESLRDERFFAAARDQLAYARSLETPSGALPWPEGPGIPAGREMHGKNSNVRLALGYYAAFKASGDPRYLKDFDRSLAFFDRLPRGETTSSVTGRRFILPVYVFVGFEMPKAESGVSIDPNQDASVALAYTLAFHEPASIFFLNSAVGERARENLAAALDMIREDGFLPLADEPTWRDKCDTAYSWWTLYQAHLANGFWQDQSAARKIQAAYDYLRPAVAAGRTVRVYPMTYDGSANNPEEFWLALPVAAAYGRSGDIEAIYAVLNRIYERPQGWWDTPGGYTWGTTERMSR